MPRLPFVIAPAAILVVLSFWALYALRPSGAVDGDGDAQWTAFGVPAGAAALLPQVDAQRRFQAMLRRLQHPVDCAKAGLLIKLPEELDGFALEQQAMARVLQVAMATGRTLVISSAWRSSYEPPGCNWDPDNPAQPGSSSTGWACLMRPISNCSAGDDDSVGASAGEIRALSSVLPGLPSGIITGVESSRYFDVRYYGAERVVAAPAWPWPSPGMSSIDVVGRWERTYGRFWVRSQMVHALWRPSDGLAREIARRTPPGTDRPYICFHIRYTDNIADLAKDFGRNATVTRDFGRYMRHAAAFRTEHPALKLSTIYLATDNIAMIAQSKHAEWKAQGWTFILQTGVQRSDSVARMWFAEGRKFGAAAVATDIEAMRRADFLVGSFQSNVYRLGAELNMAWLVDKYPIHMDRHRTVDVEWFEDP